MLIPTCKDCKRFRRRDKSQLCFSCRMIRKRYQNRKKYRIPISDLKLTARAQNCLSLADIRTTGELVMRSEEELLRCKNFGRKTLIEIKQVLAQYNFELRDEMREKIVTILKSLTPREKKIIYMHFGIHFDLGVEGMTMSQIGTALSIGCERVRQIEVRALRKLKKEIIKKI